MTQRLRTKQRRNLSWEKSATCYFDRQALAVLETASACTIRRLFNGGNGKEIIYALYELYAHGDMERLYKTLGKQQISALYTAIPSKPSKHRAQVVKFALVLAVFEGIKRAYN